MSNVHENLIICSLLHEEVAFKIWKEFIKYFLSYDKKSERLYWCFNLTLVCRTFFKRILPSPSAVMAFVEYTRIINTSQFLTHTHTVKLNIKESCKLLILILKFSLKWGAMHFINKMQNYWDKYIIYDKCCKLILLQKHIFKHSHKHI